MAEQTAIEWAHHSWSPWLGCTKVSDACDNCYAETWAKRTGQAKLWQGERRRTSAAYWRKPLSWDRDAEREGIRRRVFPSLCDPFDNQVPAEWRRDFFDLVRMTPFIDWLLLTKRPQNIAKMLGGTVLRLPKNVWIGTTTESQEEADRRIPNLLRVPASVCFLSCEPLLSDIDLTVWIDRLDWVICGGESGHQARSMTPEWARHLRDQCVSAGVPFHFKQWGGKTPKSGGRLLDGREWNEFPGLARRERDAA